MTKTDILSYLNTLRKPVSNDPTHRSVGTYNGRQMVFMKFFRWLYIPDEPDHRKRITPQCMVGVKGLPRREKSPYNQKTCGQPTTTVYFSNIVTRLGTDVGMRWFMTNPQDPTNCLASALKTSI